MKMNVLAVLCTATLIASGVASAPKGGSFDKLTGQALRLTDLSSVRGAGSTCRLGCNECAGSGYVCGCQEVGHYQLYGSEEIWITDYYTQQVWYPHLECGFAWGSDTCGVGPDVPCNKIFRHSGSSCGGTGTVIDHTDTSSCILSNPNDPPDN